MGSISVQRDVRGVSTLDLYLDEFGDRREEFARRIVASATSGGETHDGGSSILWLALRDHENPDEVYAVCVLYKRVTEGKYGYGRRGEFWYKDMSEHVGPCYYDVPKKVWDALTPLPPDEPDDSYRATWRATVAEQKAALAARPKPRPGDIVDFGDVTWGGYEPGTRFRYVEKSVFRPIFDGGDLESGWAPGHEGARVRLRGWTKQHYVLAS